MKTFPMFLKTTGRRILVIGAGQAALCKLRLLAKSDADLVLVADAPCPALADFIANPPLGRQVDWRSGPVTRDLFTDALMAFVATEDPEEDARIAGLARERGTLVNVVDAPALCDAFTPSIVDRDPVVVAIGTEGAAPILGRSIKARVEMMLPVNLGGLARLAGRLRPRVAQSLIGVKRRQFWRWVFNDRPGTLWQSGREGEALSAILNVLDSGQVPTGEARLTYLTGADLDVDRLTLGDARRIMEADLVLYDRGTDRGILELARRDAEHLPFEAPTPSHIAGLKKRQRKGDRILRLATDHTDVSRELAALDRLGIAMDRCGIQPAVESYPSSKSASAFLQKSANTSLL